MRTRLGVLTPHADVGPESEIRAMAPETVGVYAARVPFGAMAAGGAMDRTIPLAPVAAFVQPPHIDDAVSLLAAAPVAVMGIGFTSSAYVTGADAEKELIDRLQSRSAGIPVVSTCAAAVDALGVLGAERVAVVDPPWFDDELDRLGAEYFSSQGFEVVSHAACDLPSNQRSINPSELYEWILAHTPGSSQAVFVGGNGFRSVGVIAALEEELARPVLTANQVLCGACCGRSGPGLHFMGTGSCSHRSGDPGPPPVRTCRSGVVDGSLPTRGTPAQDGHVASDR
ncbi:maleate cis-trans isomerase family protein [Oryzihumus sp.]